MMKAMQQMMQHSTGACCPQQQRCACRTPPAPQLCARPQQQHLATGNGAARRQHVVAAVAAPFAPQSSPSPAAGLRPEAVGAAPGQGALPQQQQQQQQDDGYESPSSSYDASSIQVLEGLEPVRKRPGMYIGSTGQGGLHHLVYEVLDNSIDEVQGGHADRVEVELDLATGWVTVTDNGRGIPTNVHPRTGKSALETVLTVLHAGGKFGGQASGYSVSGGLHGVGISVVNALSERVEVRVWRDGRQFYQAFSRGAVLCDLLEGPVPPTRLLAAVSDADEGQQAALPRQGTQVRFLYDRTIFSPDAAFDPDVLRARLRELAFLNSAATLLLRVTGTPPARAAPGSAARAKRKPAAAAAAATLPGDEERVLAPPVDEPGLVHAAAAAAPVAHVCAWRFDDRLPQQDAGGGRRGGKGAARRAASAAAEGDAVAPAAARRRGSRSRSPTGGAPEPEGREEGVQRQSPAVVTQPMLPGSLDGAHVGHGWYAYHYPGGLQQFVASMNQGRDALHEVLYFTSQDRSHAPQEGAPVQVEVALQWCADAASESLVGFANSIRTVDGGSHLDGARAALTRVVNTLAKKLRLVKDGDPSMTGEHIREGLAGCVSVKVPNPEFEGQTKTRLGNPEVRRILDAAVTQHASEWLELHPAALQAVVSKALLAARAADAARRARELVRRKAVLTRTTLPGKLADCTSTTRGETELFVVEGDSAGGSAKQARDRFTQAILPLRGKILNVERCDEAAMLKNQEIASLIVAMGLGSKGDGLEGLRYGKLIILTDADVDGAHIRTLLLNFLFRYRPELFAQGHVYMAVPPLYKLELPASASGGGRGKGGTSTMWCYNDAQLQQATAGLAQGSYSVQRFKGLGEMMPAQLWDTTMDPARRTLRRITTYDMEGATRTLSQLMGSKVGPRKELIQQHATRFSLSDLDV